MASVSSRVGNHYDLLGLTPEASPIEIERAYRLQISPFIPQVLGGIAAASIAYQVLRDPERRRAYDLAHGLVPPPPPKPALMPARDLPEYAGANVLRATPHWRADDIIPHAQSGSVAASANPRPFLAAPQRPEMAVETKPKPAANPSLRPVAPGAGLRAEPALAAPGLSGEDVEDWPVNGRKAAIVAGIVGAVGVAGGLLGWTAGQDADQATRPAVVVAVPAATAAPLVKPVSGAPDRATVPAPPRRAQSRPLPGPVARGSSPVASVAAPVPAQPQPAAALDTAVDSEPADAGSPMPLSHSTIAATLRRIGYACGSVTSSQSQSGGVYTITCSSGQTFRAMPVHGRYRFKRQ